MKGFIIGACVVVAGAAGVWLWNKSHEDAETEIPEEDPMNIEEDN